MASSSLTSGLVWATIPWMTDCQSPDGHTHEADTALLTAALDHSWKWYDAELNRARQVINYFVVASAVLVTAYTAAINGKHYHVASVIALAGLGLTALAFMFTFRDRKRAAAAELALTELQAKIADRLDIRPFCMVGTQPVRGQRLTALIIAYGLATLLYIIAFLYELAQ